MANPDYPISGPYGHVFHPLQSYNLMGGAAEQWGFNPYGTPAPPPPGQQPMAHSPPHSAAYQQHVMQQQQEPMFGHQPQHQQYGSIGPPYGSVFEYATNWTPGVPMSNKPNAHGGDPYYRTVSSGGYEQQQQHHSQQQDYMHDLNHTIGGLSLGGGPGHHRAMDGFGPVTMPAAAPPKPTSWADKVKARPKEPTGPRPKIPIGGIAGGVASNRPKPPPPVAPPVQLPPQQPPTQATLTSNTTVWNAGGSTVISTRGPTTISATNGGWTNTTNLAPTDGYDRATALVQQLQNGTYHQHQQQHNGSGGVPTSQQRPSLPPPSTVASAALVAAAGGDTKTITATADAGKGRTTASKQQTDGGPMDERQVAEFVARLKRETNPTKLQLPAESARYFVIKSYSEDDVHRSIKYSIWCSTEHGNKRLDAAWRSQESRGGQIYLFFSVNASGHFCGVAQMLSAVDYTKQSGVWAQDKWKGLFKVRWLYVKDVPNQQLRAIRLDNNENKPVTNSRDTQEVLGDKGRQVLKLIHQYQHVTSLFDDFAHYETRQLQDSAERDPPPQQQQQGHRP